MNPTVSGAYSTTNGCFLFNSGYTHFYFFYHSSETLLILTQKIVIE